MRVSGVSRENARPTPPISDQPATPCSLKLRMLVRGVVDHQLGDHLQLAPERLADQVAEVAQRAERRLTLM